MDAGVKKILLDTNFLLIPGQFGVDVFSELDRICHFNYEVCVLAATIAELNKLLQDKKVSAKDRRAAGLGLQLLRAKKVEVIKSWRKAERKVFKSADKAILEFASAHKGQVIVASQDKWLRKKLKAEGAGVIVLRQKQYLTLL